MKFIKGMKAHDLINQDLENIYCNNRIVEDIVQEISNGNNLFEVRQKSKGGSEMKCAFININGAPHEFKNLHKA